MFLVLCVHYQHLTIKPYKIYSKTYLKFYNAPQFDALFISCVSHKNGRSRIVLRNETIEVLSLQKGRIGQKQL